VTYVHRKADPWRGGRNSVYVEGQETVRLGKTDVTATELDETSWSLDYLVRTNSLTVFYSGFYHEDEAGFRGEIDYLAKKAGHACDLAFVDTTDGEGHPRVSYIIEKLKPRAVFPMNADRDAEGCREMACWLEKNHPKVLVGLAENPGEGFAYDAGTNELRRAVQFFPRSGRGCGMTID
jgi:hypothetical protein